MKTIVHVNQHVIKSNAKHGLDNPPLTVKTYLKTENAYEVLIHDEHGNVVAKVVNRPHDPLSCGARVWIETYNPVTVIDDRAEQGEVSDEAVA